MDFIITVMVDNFSTKNWESTYCSLHNQFDVALVSYLILNLYIIRYVST